MILGGAGEQVGVRHGPGDRPGAGAGVHPGVGDGDRLGIGVGDHPGAGVRPGVGIARIMRIIDPEVVFRTVPVLTGLTTLVPVEIMVLEAQWLVPAVTVFLLMVILTTVATVVCLAVTTVIAFTTVTEHQMGTGQIPIIIPAHRNAVIP